MTGIHIRNMVCGRCVRVVREELEKLGYDVRSITLGEAVLGSDPDEEGVKALRSMPEC